MNFIRCVWYLALLSFFSFVAGRHLPRQRFSYGRFPYKSFAFEREGAFYERFKIRRWKNRLLDMSRLFPGSMPAKRLDASLGQEQVELLIQETCVAEWVHAMLCLFGFVCLSIWKGKGGLVVSLLYFVGNLPFIAAQRYNRPKLVRLLLRLRERSHSMHPCQELDFELQYETRM